MRVSHRVLAMASAFALAVGVLGSASAESGPTAPPKNVADWPGSGSGSVYKMWTDRRDFFWNERRKDQGAVVFLGDSITHGWRGLADAFPGLKTANRGIGSDSSRGLLVRLKEDVLDLNPRGIVVLIGINDLTAGSTPGDVAGNLRLLLAAVYRHNPKTPVVLCHVMPANIRPEKYPRQLRQTNALIDSLAIGRPNVTICDTWPGLATPSGNGIRELFPDGVHLSARGYEIWASNLRPALHRAGLLPANA